MGFKIGLCKLDRTLYTCKQSGHFDKFKNLYKITLSENGRWGRNLNKQTEWVNEDAKNDQKIRIKTIDNLRVFYLIIQYVS